jgi:hypothetical protein
MTTYWNLCRTSRPRGRVLHGPPARYWTFIYWFTSPSCLARSVSSALGSSFFSFSYEIRNLLNLFLVFYPLRLSSTGRRGEIIHKSWSWIELSGILSWFLTRIPKLDFSGFVPGNLNHLVFCSPRWAAEKGTTWLGVSEWNSERCIGRERIKKYHFFSTERFVLGNLVIMRFSCSFYPSENSW